MSSDLEAVLRAEHGLVLATLVRDLGDLDLAEDALQEACVAAVETWPRSGVPDRPGAWLLTTARRKGIDRTRREAKRDGKQTEAAALLEARRDPDDPTPQDDEGVPGNRPGDRRN